MPAPKLKPVSEQVIVITGATSGIGLATARMAAEKGAAVVAAARNEAALNELVQEIRQKGGRAQPVVADVSDMAQVERIAETAISAFGGFDTWCNVAGAFIYGEMEDTPLEDQRRLFDVVYWGLVHGTLVASRHLKEKGGAIVNVGSVLSDRSIALQGPYSAAKFAVKAATDAFRMEFEAEGYPISVTLIKPGPIDTPYMEHARNLTGAPGTRNPPPAYHPRVVGRAILHAAETRVRDLTVGGGGAAIAVLGRLAPRLTDLIMEKIARPTQVTDDPGRAERRDNLYQPKEDMAETSSLAGPPPRQTSFLLEAQMNPLGPAGLMIGLGALLAGAAIGMYTLRRPQPVPQRLADRAWRLGRSVAKDAGSGLDMLGHEASRIAHRALDYAEHAHKEAKPTLRWAEKKASRYADRAYRAAVAAAEEAQERATALAERARDLGGDAYDEARDKGWRLFGRARSQGEDLYDRASRHASDTYEDARDRGWSLFGRARDRGEDLYDTARKRAAGAYDDVHDRGWSLFGRARDRGAEMAEDARRRGRKAYDEAEDRGWHLFGKAREEARRRGHRAVDDAADAGHGLLDRINAFLAKRL
ncbi:SDR family oxidoreductase [Muricoccus radiodurans]|uniref:SDR family oxidoreductase n=1 Tax=Muricoccus radiodurans TaxID=2231721 RepID=UPI003CE73448